MSRPDGLRDLHPLPLPGHLLQCELINLKCEYEISISSEILKARFVHIIWPGCLLQCQDPSPARPPPPPPRPTSSTPPPNTIENFRCLQCNTYIHLVKPVKVLADARKQDEDSFLYVQQVQKLAMVTFKRITCSNFLCGAIGISKNAKALPGSPSESWDTS